MKKKLRSLIACTIVILMVLNQGVIPLLASPGTQDDVSVQGTEMITNGDFSDVDSVANTAAGWAINNANASVAVEDGKVTFQINAAGADWAPNISQSGVTLESGQTYIISYTATSSVDRSIMTGFDGGRIGMNIETLEADTEKEISYQYECSNDGNNTFMFYLGQINGEAFDVPHTISIKNVSIIKIKGAKAIFNEEDGEEVEAVPGNLLSNGNFATKGSNWQVTKENAQVYFNAYRTVFDIKQNAADWQQRLYQDVTLEAGIKYTVSFDVITTVDRTIVVGFDPAREYTSDLIIANEKTTISYITEPTTTGTKSFHIYLGSDVGAHQVEITNISIIENPVDLPDTENDELPMAITSLAGITPSEGYILRDGIFSDYLAYWETYAVDWMSDYNVVKYTSVDNGMQVYIGNTGGGEGNKPYDVQLNQKITLKKGLSYTLSFDVHSEKARSINLVIEGLGTGEFSKPIGIQKGETRHVSLNIPVQSVDQVSKLFSIQMGNVSGDVLTNNLTFTNMKIEVNGYSDLAVLIDDGDFTYGDGEFITFGEADFDTSNKQMAVTIPGGATVDNIITRNVSNIETGQTYQVSVVAGAKIERDMIVTLPNGVEETISLTTDPELYTWEFAGNSLTNGSGTLTFNLGQERGNIYLDTIRMDAEGFAEQAGIDISKHDITALTKKTPPVISEDPNAISGNDVELTFYSDQEYEDAIYGIVIDGQQIEDTKYTLESGKITIDGSLFTVTSDSQVFNIIVLAEWYKNNLVYQKVYKETQWILTFQDEFDATEVDLSKWAYQNGTGAEYGLDGWGNNEQQYYTDDNITVDESVLTIEVKEEAKGSKTYTSGRMRTITDNDEPLFSQTYGRFEAKIKLPAGEGAQGLWPAFWMLPDEQVYGGWPLSGEIDIMEARGRVGNVVDGTIHYGQSWPNNTNSGGSYTWEEDSLAISEFHIYAVEWTPESITWFVDGEEYYIVTNWYSQADGQPLQYAYPAPFDENFHLILNLAVGGSYDGNLTPDTSALPAKMEVDYVRVYQSTVDDYDREVEEPQIEKETIPDNAKTELTDPDFENVIQISKTEDQDAQAWNFIMLPDTNGSAACTTVNEEGNTLEKITIANGGTQPYAIQLVQRISLIKGRYYKVSFDAKADSNRSINVKLGGSGVENSGWGVYSSNTADLTSDLTHYEYVFQMLNATDLDARIEFNMGQSTVTTYIGNVVIEEVEGLSVDSDLQKTPLEDGNHIYNGTFNLGDTSRMTYWHTTGLDSKVVKNADYGYVFTANTGTSEESLYQQGIELLQSDTYKLVFDGSSTVDRDITVIFSDITGENIYGEEIVSLTGTYDEKTMEFTMPAGVTDKNAKITFLYKDVESTILLDNMVLTRLTYNNIDFDELNSYPLFNGDFELGTAGWGTYNTSLSIQQENGTNTGRIIGKATTNRYDALLSNDNVEILAGYDYEISFEAKASVPALIDVSLEDASYTRSFQAIGVAIGTEWESYTYSFKVGADKNLALKFMVGGANAEFTLDLDNVVIRMKGAPENPGSISALSVYNKIGEDLLLQYSGSMQWAEEAVFYIDGAEVPEELITITADSIIMDESLFDISRAYNIYAQAPGYALTQTISVTMYPANGNRIINGDFDDGMNSWATWVMDDSGIIGVENNYLKISYLYGAYSEWGLAAWAIQLVQENVLVDSGVEYKLSFVASSTLARPIIVTIDQGSEDNTQIELTKEPQEYEITFTSIKDTMKLMFQLSTVGNVAFDAHNIFIDSISLVPVGTREVEVPPVVKENSITVKANGNGTVAINGSEPADTYTYNYQVGDTVTIAAQGDTFRYWTNANNKVVSTQASFTITAATDEVYTAIFAATRTISFMNNTQLIKTMIVPEDAEAITFPDDPFSYGHIFIGWDMEEAAILTALETGDVTVYAKYTKTFIDYYVDVTKGKTTGNYEALTLVTVTADAPAAGQQFSHWVDGDGNIMNYKSTYNFYVTKDIELKAVFVAAEEEVEKAVLIRITGVVANQEASKLSFTAERALPMGVTLVQHGIILTADTTLDNDTFIIGAAGVLKGTATTTGMNGTYVLNKASVSAGDTWNARGYVIYKDASGEVQTTYTDIVSGEMP